ncbi:hypothetical protein FFY37_00035 [Klebsiella pneumoniae]|nr:hypothetical protein FFY37_00035 [Klebsiella pneumoniae]
MGGLRYAAEARHRFKSCAGWRQGKICHGDLSSVSRYVNVTTGLAGFIAAANRLKRGLNAASVGIAQRGV